jgi:hypothetical protein
MATTNQDERIAAWRQHAKDFTFQLRSGDDPFMHRLREILAQKRLDPEKSACVGAFDDLLDRYCGFLVFEDDRAIEFSLNFQEGLERQATVAMWELAAYTHGSIAGLIAAGRQLLEDERGTLRHSAD